MTASPGLCRPLLTPFEAQMLLLVLEDGEGSLETWEMQKAFDRSKAKLGVELVRVGGGKIR